MNQIETRRLLVLMLSLMLGLEVSHAGGGGRHSSDGWHQAQDIRYQVSNGNVEKIENLSNGKDCLSFQISGRIVKIAYATDAITISGFVMESRDGSRSYINVEWPRWGNPRFDKMTASDLRWIDDGLKTFLRKDGQIYGDAWSCGTGNFQYLNSVRRSPLIQSATNPITPPQSVAQAQPTDRADQTSVEMVGEGGGLRVPVTINGVLTLKFIVDSGASDVVIPADVAMTLLRAGTIEDADFLGKQTYRLADGSKLPSQQFKIHTLKVGDKVLENVTGSIAPVEGSLLLGQSFLSRFQSWSVNNQEKLLILK